VKKIEISAALRPLSEYASELDDEIMILTSQDRPVAALVPLTDIDEESRALSTNKVFLDLIERAREEVRVGKTVSFEEVKRKLSS
jgi:antitoxin (DNA-binding transcriptional repressor) of toxin-antitoxin stability system